MHEQASQIILMSSLDPKGRYMDSVILYLINYLHTLLQAPLKVRTVCSRLPPAIIKHIMFFSQLEEVFERFL